MPSFGGSAWKTRGRELTAQPFSARAALPDFSGKCPRFRRDPKFRDIQRTGCVAQILNVTAEATGPATNNYGVNNILSKPVLFAVDALASGGDNNYGINNFGAQGTLNQASARASGGDAAYGLFCNQSPFVITDLEVSVSSAGAKNYGIYVYNASPQIQDVRIEVKSGPENYGLFMSSCGSELSRLSAKVSGSGQNFGIYISDASGPKLNQVQVEASGGTANHALYSKSSSPELKSVAAVATGSDSYAVTMTDGSGSLKALHSLFWGDTQAVSNASATAVQLGPAGSTAASAAPHPAWVATMAA